MSIYIELFLSFLQVGIFSIGGGYAAMPLIQSQAVDTYGWLTLREFTDLITIAEMTPGPIAVNSATFVGIRMAGLPGALVRGDIGAGRVRECHIEGVRMERTYVIARHKHKYLTSCAKRFIEICTAKNFDAQ